MMRAPSSKSCKPPDYFFKLIPPGLNSQLSIPASFRKYMKPNTTAILKMGFRKWPVKMMISEFGEGWDDFVRENGVQEFDIVVFKHEGNMVFDTMVFDTSLCEKESSTDQVTKSDRKCKVDNIDRLLKVPPVKKEGGVLDPYFQKVDIPATPSSPIHIAPGLLLNPYFKSTVTAYFIKRSYVNIPLGFARPNGLYNRNCEMVVMDEKQRLWPTRLSNTDRSHVRIIGLGRDMTIANGLKEGDDFILELVDNGNKPFMHFYKE